MDFSSHQAFDATMRLADSKVSREAATAAAVVTAMLALSEHDPGGRFTDRIDAARIGAIGFSFGGAVAAEAGRIDRRFRGVLDMDGWLFGQVLDDWLVQPYFAMSDDTPDTTEADLHSPDIATRMMAEIGLTNDTKMYHQWERHGATLMTIAGTRHPNFSDGPLMSPLRRVTGGGPIAPVRATTIIATYVNAFFVACFGGPRDPILAQPDIRFPEVSLRIWPDRPAAKSGSDTQ